MNLPVRLEFEKRYIFGRAPWDTGESPPELLEFLSSHPPGQALDLGCGTGTNTIAMAEQGWEGTAIDISWVATARAWARVAQAGLEASIQREDLTRAPLPQSTFDLALDIGCYHALQPTDRQPYLTKVAGALRPGGCYLLYAFSGPPRGEPRWPTVDETRALLENHLVLDHIEHGEIRERPSAWYWWIRAEA